MSEHVSCDTLDTEAASAGANILQGRIDGTIDKIEREAPFYNGTPSRAGSALRGLAQELIGQSPEAAAAVTEIICDFTLNGTPITPPLGVDGTKGDGEVEKRLRLAEIYRTSPEAARTLVDNNIAGFHVGRSGDLLSTLRHGLMSGKQVIETGGRFFGGERDFAPVGGQPVISFADWRAVGSIDTYAHSGEPITVDSLHRDIAMSEESLRTKQHGRAPKYQAERRLEDMRHFLAFLESNKGSQEADLLADNFPVAYGLDIGGFGLVYDGIRWDRAAPGDRVVSRTAPGDIKGEFWSFATVTMDDMPVVAVPSARVAQVYAYVSRLNINTQVIPLELLVSPRVAESYNRFAGLPEKPMPLPLTSARAQRVREFASKLVRTVLGR